MNRKLVVTGTVALAAVAALVGGQPVAALPGRRGRESGSPAGQVAVGRTDRRGRPCRAALRRDPGGRGDERQPKFVAVEEGDRVRKGQVIAALENADFAARVALAKAELAQKEAADLRARNGSRPEELPRSRRQSVAEAKAVLDNAQSELRRRTALYQSGDIARSNSRSPNGRCRWRGLATKRPSSGRRSPTAPPAAKTWPARAPKWSAPARSLAEAEAMFNKTLVRSPIDGIVLRKHLKTGESFSDQTANVVVTLGDNSRLRVRADVDESDVGRVRAGQSAYVTAEAYGDRRFRGTVVRVGQILGRKNVRTDAPSERVDTKVLETLIELDAGVRLPAGLRVDTFIHDPLKRSYNVCAWRSTGSRCG